MSNLTTKSTAIESALIAGDLSKLSPDERLSYYNNVCNSLGLNPLTQPFAYITLNGKLTLYAKRDATDQLRKVHRISIAIISRETIEGVYVVTARASDTSGRHDESTGAVTINGLKGDALANAFLKSETKAKRRVTLSICGLGLLDESEVETIPQQRERIVTKLEEQVAKVKEKQEITEEEDSVLDVIKDMPKVENKAPISTIEYSQLLGLASTKKISMDALDKRILDKWNIDSSSKINRSQFDEIMKALNK